MGHSRIAFRAISYSLQQGRPLSPTDAADRHDALKAVPEWVRPADAQCLRAVIQFARLCHVEPEHTAQVARLSLRLFDELTDVHRLGAGERFWLACGAVLHDVGIRQGTKGHHKTGLRMILEAPELPLTPRAHGVVANIARYHRKALPTLDHEQFAALDPRARVTVEKLAALLRVGDGLDRSHLERVGDLTCRTDRRRIVVNCDATGPAQPEQQAATKKGDLLERVYRRRLCLRMIDRTRAHITRSNIH